MADQYLTLKDIAARQQTDDVVGLVEAVVNVAPELDLVTGRVINGVSYNARVRTALPANIAFRKANSGVPLGASSYDRERFNCYFLDAQMRADEATIIAAEAEGDSMGKVLSEEASGQMRAKALYLGEQFYTGQTHDANGFPGLIDFLNTQQAIVDSRTGAAIDQVVDAGGSAGGKCEMVWFFKRGPQGVGFLFGAGRGLSFNPWTPIQAPSQDNAGFARVWTANASGYIGLSCADYHSLGAIENVDASISGGNYVKPLTDALTAALYAKFPIGTKPDICFATQGAIASLQASRSVTLFANGDAAAYQRLGAMANVAPWPTNLPQMGGIPIVPTDSILKTNATNYAS